MKRPYVSLDNPEVYPYYTQRQPDVEFMRKFHAVVGKVLSAETVSRDHTPWAVARHLSEGGQTMWILNHATFLDPGFAAGVLHNVPECRPIIGNIVIAANAPYFNKPGFGWLFDKGGAIPAFRKKDIKNLAGTMSPEELEAKRKQAGEHLINICIGNIDNGRHVALYAEGTRNRGDRQEIQPIQNGPLKIIEGIQRPDDLMVVILAAYYGNRQLRNIASPTAALSHIDPCRTRTLTKNEIRSEMQSALDLAVDVYEHEPRPLSHAARALASHLV